MTGRGTNTASPTAPRSGTGLGAGGTPPHGWGLGSGPWRGAPVPGSVPPVSGHGDSRPGPTGTGGEHGLKSIEGGPSEHLRFCNCAFKAPGSLRLILFVAGGRPSKGSTPAPCLSHQPTGTEFGFCAAIRPVNRCVWGTEREAEGQRGRGRERGKGGRRGGREGGRPKDEPQPLKVIPILTANRSHLLCFQCFVWEHFAARLIACLLCCEPSGAKVPCFCCGHRGFLPKALTAGPFPGTEDTSFDHEMRSVRLFVLLSWTETWGPPPRSPRLSWG